VGSVKGAFFYSRIQGGILESEARSVNVSCDIISYFGHRCGVGEEGNVSDGMELNVLQERTPFIGFAQLNWHLIFIFSTLAASAWDIKMIHSCRLHTPRPVGVQISSPESSQMTLDVKFRSKLQ
jgi:hypothetical protein